MDGWTDGQTDGRTKQSFVTPPVCVLMVLGPKLAIPGLYIKPIKQKRENRTFSRLMTHPTNPRGGRLGGEYPSNACLVVTHDDISASLPQPGPYMASRGRFVPQNCYFWRKSDFYDPPYPPKKLEDAPIIFLSKN